VRLAGLKGQTQSHALAEQVLLTDNITERLRAQAFR
jgi:hypothetical protein